MSNSPANAVRDKLMAFAHIKTYRPIPAERPMRCSNMPKAVIAKNTPSRVGTGWKVYVAK